MSRPAVALLLLAAAAGGHAATGADAVTGFWQTAGGGAVIRIVARDDAYRGRLVWLREARYPADDPRGIGGQPVTDRHNPDPAKRDRPLIGMPILTGLHYHAESRSRDTWRDGRIYNSENGKRYHCYVWLADADHLELHGYIGVPLLGHTTTWRRVTDPQSRSDE